MQPGQFRLLSQPDFSACAGNSSQRKQKIHVVLAYQVSPGTRAAGLTLKSVSKLFCLSGSGAVKQLSLSGGRGFATFRDEKARGWWLGRSLDNQIAFMDPRRIL